MAQELVLAVDMGGTRIRGAVVTLEGVVKSRISRLTQAEEGREWVWQRFVATLKELAAPFPSQAFLALAVAAPGPLDPEKGVIYHPPNLPCWNEMPLKELLEREFPFPCFLGNDANLAALGEYRFGAWKGEKDLVLLTVGTGIGGGVISGGKLLLGSEGLGGELGHILVQRSGPRCACGAQGCLEALASGTAIARQAKESLALGVKSTIPRVAGEMGREITGEAVVEAARRGDPLASGILSRAASYLGMGVASLIHIFNPRLVLLGGGVSNARPLLLEPVRETVDSLVMPRFKHGLRIELASLGDDAGILGGVALVLQESSK